MRKVLVLMLLSLFAFVTSPGADARPAPKVGIVLSGSSLFFYQALIAGMNRAAADLGAETLMRNPADGASVVDQRNIQLKLIDYVVQNGVDGVLLVPETLAGVTAPVRTPVPLVLVDRGSADYVAAATVSTDNVAAGAQAARSLEAVLSPGAHVAILRLAPDIVSTSQREAGFMRIARERGWEIVVDAYVGFRPRDAEEGVAKALDRYPGRLDAVFAPAEPVAYGALHYFAGKPAGVRPRIVAFDWRPEFADSIRNGLIYADIMQDPFRMGYLAMQTLVGVLRGESSGGDRSVDTVTVTKDNLDTPPIRALRRQFEH